MSHKESIFKAKEANPKLGYDRLGALLNIHPNTVRYHLSKAYKEKVFQPFQYKRLTKQEAVAILGGKCIICGYDKCIDALDFHHKGDKSFNIARGFSTKLNSEKMLEEIRKCDLLCSNCHRELHSKERTK
jgi:hypothetical protein